MYFNQKMDRSGALFQSVFKSKHIDSDEYLKYMFSYIHLNPVKIIQPDWKEKGIYNTNKTFEFLIDYKNSSFINYYEEGKNNKILNKTSFPEYFLSRKNFEANLLDWLKYGYHETEAKPPYRK
jgi:putative transposase